jgi:hypothetical protein
MAAAPTRSSQLPGSVYPHFPSRVFCCRFIGEWYEKEEGHHAPTEEQIEEGSRSCFIVGGIYLGWVVFALFCVCIMSARGRR